MTKRVFLISILILILLSSCIFFETINQPSAAAPNETFRVSIHTTTEGGEYEPYFGVCLPDGWTVPGDSVLCSGVYNEVIYYNDSLSTVQNDVSPAPLGYYWWAGKGVVDTSSIGDVNAELLIQTDNQTGFFSIDYMLGNSYYGVNHKRSNDHRIEIPEEFTPWGLEAVVAGDSVIIHWGQPFNTVGLLGYYIYRDEQQINPLLVTDTTFIDENPLEGLHHYSVSSYYSDGSEYLIPYEVQVMYGNSLYVSPNGSNTNSGSSFGEALLTINYALSKLTPDSLNYQTIYLSQGIFSPSTTGEVFPLEWKNYIYLEGISEEGTILDGDSLSGILQCESITEAKFEYLTIRNGNRERGGGIYCNYSSPDLFNIKITNNTSRGIYCDNSSPSLEYVTIEENDGGGIYCIDNSSPTLNRVIITNNSAYNGGGIYCAQNSSPILDKVIITDNSVDNDGGGIYCIDNSGPTLDSVIIANNSASLNGGGMILRDNSNSQLVNVIIIDNSAFRGGGLICRNNSNLQLVNVFIIENSAQYAAGMQCIDSSPTLQNVTITNNSAVGKAGGIYCDRSTPLLLNVIITGNSAGGYGGGIFCWRESNPILKNCILWNDSPGEIFLSNSFDPNTITISYSDIQGGETGIITNNGTVNWLDGNINKDPLFVGTGNFPFTLSDGSPCIDTGDPNTIYNDPEDPNNLGFALLPAMGTLRNDMGAYGGPHAASWNIIVTSTEDDETEELQTPTEFKLAQNYPNPFNPTTTIQYGIKERSSVELILYDILGREVEVLVNEEQDVGYYKVSFNAGRLASGIYLYRLQAGDFIETKKMVLVK